MTNATQHYYFIITFSLILVGMSLLAWNIYHFYQVINRVVERDARAMQLKSEIAGMEKQMTLLTELIVETGQLEYIPDHQQLTLALDSAIEEALEIVPPKVARHIDRKIHLAEQQLVEAEMKAFTLMKEGKQEAAEAIIFGTGYQQQEQTYQEGIKILDAYLHEAHKSLLKDERRIEYLTIVVLIVILASLTGMVFLYCSEIQTKQALRKSNRAITAQNEAIQHQKGKIEKQNKEITQKQKETVKQKLAIEKQHKEISVQKKQIEQAHEDLHQLTEIGKVLTATLSIEAIATTLYEKACTLLPMDVLSIATAEADTYQITTLLKEGEIQNKPIEVSKSVFYKYVLQEEKEVVVLDLKAEKELWFETDTTDLSVQSLIFLPLMGSQGLLGIISVQAYEKDSYTPHQLDMLRGLAAYVAIAIENAQVYTQIDAQSELLKKKNDNIVASINYASRIQKAMLPSVEDIQTALPHCFILYKPRDIVSGDFYWFAEQDEKIFIAAVDCTGHGVPGAFMSLIGATILNQIINLRKIYEADQILLELHKGVQRALKQDENKTRDGMDLALCIIDKRLRILKFAGAKNPLIYIQDGHLRELKGTNKPIGGFWRALNKDFEKSFVNLGQDTTLYLFSDGFQDQFGGAEGRKFMKRRLKSLLIDIHQEPMEKQRKVLEKAINDWMSFNGKTFKQIDDIMMIGVKINDALFYSSQPEEDYNYFTQEER
ncbi:MAG: GAF domain-containing SpoIIE family protein phosphatase [Thermonemataceae bacterium]